jgi:tryptophan-rich sensory protein
VNDAQGGRVAPVLVAAALAIVTAAAGALVTDLGPWYQSLRVPAWKPPDWLFGPAWTLIFSLTALAGVTAWGAERDRRYRIGLVAMFVLNGVLNVLWSAFFFRLQRPDWAMIEVALLWLSILLLIVVLGRVSRRAAWLLVPYLAWVSIAAALTLAVARLNGPFA